MGDSDVAKTTEDTKSNEESFSNFYAEVKEIEKRDATLTPAQQIARLNRPGSTYFNLNPFDVLQVDPETSLDDIKQKYRRMSILVHPDKNREDTDNAQKAFEALNKAWKTLQNEEGYKKCQEIVQEAKLKVDQMIDDKKRAQKKAGQGSRVVEEEDPEQYKRAVYVQTCKLFADLERLRRETEAREMHERKRKAEEEVEAEEDKKIEQEWQQNFEESRKDRVNSWRNFKSSKKATKTFKPPKPKQHGK